MGLIYGEFDGRSDEFEPGGVSFEYGMGPHGGDWAWKSKEKHEHDLKMWDNLVDNFSGNMEEVKEILGKVESLTI